MAKAEPSFSGRKSVPFLEVNIKNVDDRNSRTGVKTKHAFNSVYNANWDEKGWLAPERRGRSFPPLTYRKTSILVAGDLYRRRGNLWETTTQPGKGKTSNESTNYSLPQDHLTSKIIPSVKSHSRLKNSRILKQKGPTPLISSDETLGTRDKYRFLPDIVNERDPRMMSLESSVRIFSEELHRRSKPCPTEDTIQRSRFRNRNETGHSTADSGKHNIPDRDQQRNTPVKHHAYDTVDKNRQLVSIEPAKSGYRVEQTDIQDPHLSGTEQQGLGDGSIQRHRSTHRSETDAFITDSLQDDMSDRDQEGNTPVKQDANDTVEKKLQLNSIKSGHSNDQGQTAAVQDRHISVTQGPINLDTVDGSHIQSGSDQESISLDEDCYEAFYARLLEIGNPDYLQRTFLGNNAKGDLKICVDVDYGRKHDMLSFLNQQFERLSLSHSFDVIEQGRWPNPTAPRLTADSNNMIFIFEDQDFPGTKLPKVQRGSLIAVVAGSEVQMVDDNGVTFVHGFDKEGRKRLSGTLTAIMMDRRNEQLYGITVRHLMQSDTNACSKVHSFCKVPCFLPLKKSFVHLGKTYVTPRDGGIDIAAIPIMQDIQQNSWKHLDVCIRNKKKEIVEVQAESVKNKPLYTDVWVKGARSEAKGQVINRLCDEFSVAGKPYRKCFQVGYCGKHHVVNGDSGALVTEAIQNKKTINAYGTVFGVSENYFNRGDGKTYPCVSVNQCFQTALQALKDDCGLDLQFCNRLNYQRPTSDFVPVRVKCKPVCRRSTIE